jgi:hypothetical protein
MLIFDRTKMPLTAENIENAWGKGAPWVLTRTIDPVQISANRAATVGQYKGRDDRTPGFAFDEYPFASTFEGGNPAIASVRLVPREEQDYQGGKIRAFYNNPLRPIPHGQRFGVVIDTPSTVEFGSEAVDLGPIGIVRYPVIKF